jgi:hypothetical protein
MREPRQHNKGRPRHNKPEHLLNCLLAEHVYAAQTSSEKMRYIIALIKVHTLSALKRSSS